MGEGAERSGTAERNGGPFRRNGTEVRSVPVGTERNGGVSEMGRNGTERRNGGNPGKNTKKYLS